jgi:hypothetical protein
MFSFFSDNTGIISLITSAFVNYGLSWVVTWTLGYLEQSERNVSTEAPS